MQFLLLATLCLAMTEEEKKKLAGAPKQAHQWMQQMPLTQDDQQRIAERQRELHQFLNKVDNDPNITPSWRRSAPVAHSSPEERQKHHDAVQGAIKDFQAGNKQ
jgi:hypothetical protein